MIGMLIHLIIALSITGIVWYLVQAMSRLLPLGLLVCVFALSIIFYALIPLLNIAVYHSGF